jgi:hypothetical protein
MSLGSREELGAHHVDGLPSQRHVNLWHVEQKGRGGGGVCQMERIHIYSLFRVGCPHGGGLSCLRGVVCHQGLSACRWLSHLRRVVSRQATIVAKTNSNSQGRLVGS